MRREMRSQHCSRYDETPLWAAENLITAKCAKACAQSTRRRSLACFASFAEAFAIFAVKKFEGPLALTRTAAAAILKSRLLVATELQLSPPEGSTLARGVCHYSA